MRKPWSISTTVRNPERLRDFLRVLKLLEGKEFNKDNQIKYQVLLIKEKIYKPNYIPSEFLKYYEDPQKEMPYEVALKLFEVQGYEDPPMRGRQSVNPLNKLGFAIAREGYGPVVITELGNKFLSEEYDIGYIFFKSLLKLQFPNPWSTDFSEKYGFDISPFLSVLKLIKKVEYLTKEEFCIFVPTLINFNWIDEYARKILEFRKKTKSDDKENFIVSFLKEFYGVDKLEQKKINNVFDYGDNILRYFRLTRYFRVTFNDEGYIQSITIEPSRDEEVNQLLENFTGQALKFNSIEEYLKYLSDISKPDLPWESEDKLRKLVTTLKNEIVSLKHSSKLTLSKREEGILEKDIHRLKKSKLFKFYGELRAIKVRLTTQIKVKGLTYNISKLKEMIEILRDRKVLKNYESWQFEKLITEILYIINDADRIKPNYPIDDNGEPINHAPGNKPDIEVYYKKFRAIYEVTLNTSRSQWYLEGYPIMRHLRDFENQNKNYEVFCIFIAPKIHSDTYHAFWVAINHGYDGKLQNIVPLTCEQFAILLEKLEKILKSISDEAFIHEKLYNLYSKIVSNGRETRGFSEWVRSIDRIIKEIWYEA